MQTVTASAVTASFVPPPLDRTDSGLGEAKLPRYTIGVTIRQETMLLEECRRRGIGFSELIRRILDGWVERKLQQEGGQ